MSISHTGWTYGVEHELVDWPRSTPLPFGCAADTNEYTIMNSTGIATDPGRRVERTLTYDWGQEINTPPTDSMDMQVSILELLLERLPMAAINHRSELNIHIRVPGLRDDLPALKRLARFNAQFLEGLLPLIDPIDKPDIKALYAAGATADEVAGHITNYRNRRRMQHVVLVPERTARMMAADTVEAFFEAEVPKAVADGRPMWHAQPRAAVNLRQLKQTDTVEFRHWPATLDPEALLWAGAWCGFYLRWALLGLWETADLTPSRIYNAFCANHDHRGPTFPTQLPYQHWMEARYKATNHDPSSGNTRESILAAIAAIEAGTFDEVGLSKPSRLPLMPVQGKVG